MLEKVPNKSVGANFSNFTSSFGSLNCLHHKDKD